MIVLNLIENVEEVYRESLSYNFPVHVFFFHDFLFIRVLKYKLMKLQINLNIFQFLARRRIISVFGLGTATGPEQ